MKKEKQQGQTIWKNVDCNSIISKYYKKAQMEEYPFTNFVILSKTENCPSNGKDKNI